MLVIALKAARRQMMSSRLYTTNMSSIVTIWRSLFNELNKESSTKPNVFSQIFSTKVFRIREKAPEYSFSRALHNLSAISLNSY
jgi:hypothetical protein